MLPAEVNTIYGVDAAKNGWVVARGTPDLSEVTIHLIPALEPLFWRVMRDDGLLAIDIPIGLPSSASRACDRAARQMLQAPRASSVFPAPTRAALQATTYSEACQLNYEASGRKLSRQTFNLIPRLREVDKLIWVERQARIYEAHPEVSFMMLAGADRGLATLKKTAAGKQERIDVLGPWLPQVDLVALLQRTSGRVAPLDDQLDALACLVTASRIAGRSAIRLPEGRIEFDHRSLRMEILA